MKGSDLRQVGWTIAVLSILVQSGLGQGAIAQTATTATSIESLARPVQNGSKWVAQGSAASVRVTKVRLNFTPTELQVILETPTGQTLPAQISTAGNRTIADIDNAILNLPEGGTFRAENPTTDIAEVTVTQTSPNRIQVSITGKETAPPAKVIAGRGLTLSVTPSSNEEVTINVIGQRLNPYRRTKVEVGSKTDTPLRDLPQSIQVIPQQVIKEQGISRISDAVRNVSSVSVERGYLDNTDSYRIRGFVNFNVLRNGFFAQDPSINPATIDRVEVLKGPASVLYGQFEPGGVVNFVTKKPLDKRTYSAEISAGSYGTFKPSIDLSGPLNADKTLLYRVNTAYSTAGSFVDFVNSRQFVGAAALTYKLSDATKLDFEYEYNNESRKLYDGLPPSLASLQVPINRFSNEPSDPDYTTKATNLTVTLDHKFNDNLQLKSYFDTRKGTFASEGTRLLGLDADGRTATRYSQVDSNVDLQSYSIQNNLIAKFSTGSIEHQALFGLEWSRSLYADDYYNNFAGGTAITPGIDIFNPVYGGFTRPSLAELNFEPFKEERNTVALTLQDQIAVLPNLKFVVGGRYDFVDRTNTNSGGAERFYDAAFSPRVGVVYQPSTPISLYASYSTSFQPSTSRTADGVSFAPERGTGYEVGVKADLSPQLSATLAAYEITKTNVSTTDPSNPAFSIAAGQVKSRGIELDIVGEISPGWNVIASAFVNNAAVSQDNSLPIGDRLVNAPGVGASLWTTYELKTGDLKGLGIGGGLFYVGEREAELPNTFKIPSYVRADATIFYKRDDWRFGLNFKNLTGTRYYDSQGFYLLPGAPFTVVGTVSVNF